MGQTRSQGQSKPQGTARSAGSGRRARRSSALRRPPEKGLPLVKYRLRTGWEATLELSTLWVLLFLTVVILCLLPGRLFQVSRVEPGTVAARTYIADRNLSVVNEAATQELRRAAAESVLPVYDFNREVAGERAGQFSTLFATGRGILEREKQTAEEGDATPAADGETEDLELAPDAPDLLQVLIEASGLKLTAEEAEWLNGREFPAEIEDRLTGVLRRVLRQGVVGDKDLLLGHRVSGINLRDLGSGEQTSQLDLYRYLDYPDQVGEAVEQDVHSWDGLALRKSDRDLLTGFVLANVEPNLTLNSSESRAQREAAVDAVGSLSHLTRKGEVIVRKGEVIDELAARTIDGMAGGRDRMRQWITAAGHLLLLTAAMVLVWLTTGLEHRRDRSRLRLFNECLILLMVHVVGVHFTFFVANAISNAIETAPWNSLESYTYAVPFASLALLAVLLYGRNVAFVLSLVFALLVGHAAGGETILEVTLFSLMSSLAAVFALDNLPFRQRSVMIRAAWVIALVNAVGVVTLKALAGKTAGGFSQLGFDFLCAFVGAFLAAAVTSFLVPVFEALFGITTYIKLLELSNTNLPLLRRLALEAPGTFQHSIAVANLAKAGCEAIGLDSVLVHTSALYHDIGKIFRPQYFVENQVPGQNPHDKIQPSMSALIIINHVKEGLELAHKHNLPQPLFDAIEQHHGTALIRFFYKRAQERCDPETEGVREDDFRYPGPKPQSKEMGILMLADGVEAASRTLVEPSRQKIRGLISKLFDSALSDHQLDQTDLTLGDVGKVQEAFLTVLTNIYHRRIDYPGFDFNRPEKGKGSGKIAAVDTAPELPQDGGRPTKRRRRSPEEVPAATESPRSKELGERVAS